MVTPDGLVLTADRVLAGVRSQHGAKVVRIWIEHPTLVHSDAATLTARYEEWQEADGVERGRVSTVVFGRDESLPYGLRWRTVHETWLPAQRP